MHIRQNPWISEAKTHGKAGTLQGESWLHYLKGKKREKKGRGDWYAVAFRT